jgi:hypothetical protein
VNDELAWLTFTASQRDQCLSLGFGFGCFEGSKHEGAVLGCQPGLYVEHPVLVPFAAQMFLFLLVKRALGRCVKNALEAADQSLELTASRMLSDHQEVFFGFRLSHARERADLAVGEFAARERFRDPRNA